MNQAIKETQNRLASKIATIAERMHNSDFGSIFPGYSPLSSSDKHRKDIEKREKTRHARYEAPFVRRGCDSWIDFVYSRGPNLRAVTKHDGLQELINSLIDNPLSNDPERNVWNLIAMSEHELVDGVVIFRLLDNESGIIIRDSNVDEFDPELNIKNSSDGEFTWLHARDYMVGEDHLITFYPDVDFWPSEELVAKLESQVRGLELHADIVEIDWNVRILKRILNGGVPVAWPALAYAICLDDIIEMQTAVLASIASASTQYIVDEASVDQAALGFQEIADNAHLTKQNQAMGIDGAGFTANTVIGSGRLLAVNLQVAMLNETAAVYRLLLSNIYNTFPGLRPQDWAEDEPGGLNRGGNPNQRAILSAKRKQQVFKELYEDLFEAACIISMEQSGVTTLTGDDDDGDVSIFNYEYLIDDSLVTVKRLVYTNEDDRIGVWWPEVEQRDTTAVIQAWVHAATLGGKLAKPVGIPSDLGRIASVLGLPLTLEGDNWDDHIDSASTEAEARVERLITLAREMQTTVD